MKIDPFFFAVSRSFYLGVLLSGVRRFPNFRSTSRAVGRRMSGSFASKACFLAITPGAYHCIIESIEFENNGGVELFLSSFELNKDIPTFRQPGFTRESER